jgi:hypothetical protein
MHVPDAIEIRPHCRSSRSDQPQRELMPIMPFMAFNEILDAGWHVAQLQIAAASQFLSDILGHVLRPALGSIERDDADWIAVLSGQKVLDNRFQIGGLAVGFSPDLTQAAEIFGNEVDVIIGAARHNRRRQFELRIESTLHATEPGFNRKRRDSFRPGGTRLT